MSVENFTYAKLLFFTLQKWLYFIFLDFPTCTNPTILLGPIPQTLIAYLSFLCAL